jgi:hypothetical protein
MSWSLPPLGPKRAASGVAGLRYGSGQRKTKHALMSETSAGKPQAEAIPLNNDQLTGVCEAEVNAANCFARLPLFPLGASFSRRGNGFLIWPDGTGGKALAQFPEPFADPLVRHAGIRDDLFELPDLHEKRAGEAFILIRHQ